MGVREDLEEFKSSHPGVLHLVYCDVSTTMVLLALASGKVGQEAHDALAKSAKSALSGPCASLSVASNNAAAGLSVLMALPEEMTLIVQSPVAEEEALALSLADDADIASITAASREILTSIGGDGG